MSELEQFKKWAASVDMPDAVLPRAWMAWQASADRAQPAQRIIELEDKQPQAEKRCQYCDGSGDVHSIDGQWRGECHCQKQPQAEVGNSGFDHKTAADFLSGKTVSDEAVRKFVQASRWAHDDRASLQSTLLSVRNELASREAEIALLKKELMEAEAAPQQAEAVPAAMKVLLDAMRSDPDYAWGWYRNVAMAFVDAGGDPYIANQGAARFMRLLANVEPAHELPEAPQQAEAVPPGYVLVPVEPTPEIVAVMAVQEASGSINGAKTIGMAGAVAAYDAMLATAQGEKPCVI